MKKIALCAAAFVLSMGVLAGCTSSNEKAESNENEASTDVVIDEALQAELEAVHEFNVLENVFNTYVVASYVAETWSYEDGVEVYQYTDREQYNSAGRCITYFGETESEDDIFGMATYVDDEGSVATCSSMPSIDFYALGVYPSDEYATSVSQQWLSRDTEVFERVISIAEDEETGSKIIAAESVYEESGIRVQVTYFVDAETGFLTGFDQITYDEAGEPMSVTRANIMYNEPLDLATNPVADVFGADDLCKLTVVFNPGQDNEETQTFSVVKGVSVSVVARADYELYNDAELTDPCDDVATDGDEAVVYVKYLG